MPTHTQLQKFYQVVRQAVLLSSYIAFVELLEDGDLAVYLGRYEQPLSRTVVYIEPNGRVKPNE